MAFASVFLLGMAVNLIGLPSQTAGGAHLASMVFLAVHALIALGLVIGSVLLLRAAARLGGRWRGQGIAGAAAIAMAVAAGILTVITSSNWWSYAMAVGFIAAVLAYGSLLLPPIPPAHDSMPPLHTRGWLAAIPRDSCRTHPRPTGTKGHQVIWANSADHVACQI